MKNKITHKISLPVRIKNLSYYEKEIEISGKRQIFRNGEPEFLSLKDKSQDALNDAFTKIEQIAYSDAQLKSINDFFLKIIGDCVVLDFMKAFNTITGKYINVMTIYCL